MRLKKLKFYKQSLLLEFKTSLVKRIKNIEQAILINKKNNEHKELISNWGYLKDLLSDQKKIKKAIARKNFFMGINNIIFNREEVAKELAFLTTLSKNRDKQVQLFKSLKEDGFIIEDRINQLQKKLQKISNMQEKINNWILSYSLLTFRTL